MHTPQETPSPTCTCFLAVPLHSLYSHPPFPPPRRLIHDTAGPLVTFCSILGFPDLLHHFFNFAYIRVYPLCLMLNIVYSPLQIHTKQFHCLKRKNILCRPFKSIAHHPWQPVICSPYVYVCLFWNVLRLESYNVWLSQTGSFHSAKCLPVSFHGQTDDFLPLLNKWSILWIYHSLFVPSPAECHLPWEDSCDVTKWAPSSRFQCILYQSQSYQ